MTRVTDRGAIASTPHCWQSRFPKAHLESFLHTDSATRPCGGDGPRPTGESLLPSALRADRRHLVRGGEAERASFPWPGHASRDTTRTPLPPTFRFWHR